MILQVAALAGAATAAAAVTLAWWLRRRLLIVTVHGPSMRPTFQDGQQLLVRRVTNEQLTTGQAVVLDVTGLLAAESPGGWPPAGQLVKRIVALPGDTVPATMAPGCTVPATMAPEVTVPVGMPVPGERVPAGCLLVHGDNLADSFDSRQLGYIAADRVIGLVLRPLRPRRSGGTQAALDRGGA